MTTGYVVPREHAPAPVEAVEDAVPPGFNGRGLKAGITGLHEPAGNTTAIFVIGTSPVFFITITQVPTPVGVATNLTWSIIAVGLLPAIPARLKKTPETTTAAATVIAISRITATNGLKPTDVYLLISTTPLNPSY
jgi:hypothetical protein